MTISRRLAADGFTLPGAEPSYAPDLALEPRHIEIRLAFDLETRSAAGSVTTTVRCNRAGARTLRLDAIAFDDVAVEGPAWSYDGERLDLVWDEPFAAGEERPVTVRYRVVEPITGLFFSGPEAAYPDRPRMVWTDHETERARYWLPCVDYPVVRTTFDFHLTAPADLTILANGALVGESEEGATKTAHWRLEQPCPSYLCCFAIGAFVRYDDETVDGCPIAYLGGPRFTPEQLRLAFGRTPAMLRWLVQRLGQPFPFPKYFQAALPAVGGAMENISLVTWDDVFILDEATHEEIAQRVDAVNIHEMAHSYFGDDVVCRHFDDAWLKESWAVYIETVYWEETASRDEADYDLHLNSTQYIEEADERYVRPIATRTYSSSWDLFDRHLYPGGAMRLHMLRHLVGDDAFWAATKDYLGTFSGKVVETADFRKVMEKHAGLNLNPFFDQWIRGKGYPRLKASYKHDAEKNEATLTVEQTQVDEKKGIGLFRLPLEFAWQDDAGTHTRTLDLEKERHATVFKTAGKPKWICLDPDSKALFAQEFNPGDEMLHAVLADGARIRQRIWAADELIKTGKRRNLEAVDAAMSSEPFWRVRTTVAKSLGDSGHAAAIPPLAAMLLREPDARAKQAIAAACGKMRDPRLRDALRAFLDAGPAPWARGEALASLGAQRDPRDVDLLVAACDEDDLHRLGARGALRGLGRMRTREALDALAARLPYGEESDLSRHVAVAAYGECARALDRETRAEAVDRLIDLTRDPRDRVRRAAGSALSGLADARALPALESLKRITAAQDAPAIDRWMGKIRKGAPGGEVTALREQLEKLEERYRKLDERLQDLEARPD